MVVVVAYDDGRPVDAEVFVNKSELDEPVDSDFAKH